MFASATGLLNANWVVLGPPQVPFGFFTGTDGFCLMARLMIPALVVFTFSCVLLNASVVPSFSHLRVWLSRLRRTDARSKPDPGAIPSWLKYSPDKKKLVPPLPPLSESPCF